MTSLSFCNGNTWNSKVVSILSSEQTQPVSHLVCLQAIRLGSSHSGIFIRVFVIT